MRSDEQIKQSARIALTNLGFTDKSIDLAVHLLRKNRITIHDESAEVDALAGQLLRTATGDDEDFHWARGRVVWSIEEYTHGSLYIHFTDGSHLLIAGHIAGGDPNPDPNASGRLSSAQDE